MALTIGKSNSLKVIRKTDIAYILRSEQNEEVFLHVNESNHQELVPNQMVDAFLYFDAKGRLTATLAKPLVEIDRPGILKVVSVNPGLGVFMDLGISKDVLLSKDFLPANPDEWPTVGDQLLVELILKSKLVARPLTYNELRVVVGNLSLHDEVEGHIQDLGKIGLFILTQEGNTVLVRKSNLRGTYRLGQKVTVKITYESEKGYEGSLAATKEVVRLDDADLIMKILDEHSGIMPYTADTDSETISAAFGLSRKAFKRALGLLYKQRKVKFEEGKTIKI